MYKKFTQCFREQVQIACYVPDTLMLTPELSDRSEFLYSLLPRPRKRSLDLGLDKEHQPSTIRKTSSSSRNASARLIEESNGSDNDGTAKDSSNKTETAANNKKNGQQGTLSSAKLARWTRTIIIKRRFLNRTPNNFHGHPDLVEHNQPADDEYQGQQGEEPADDDYEHSKVTASGQGNNKRRKQQQGTNPLPPWATTTTEALTMAAPRPTSSWLATLTGDSEEEVEDGIIGQDGGQGVFGVSPTSTSDGWGSTTQDGSEGGTSACIIQSEIVILNY